ncbi:LytTR family transcriptional regulator [Rhodocytophaga rosea]|uniref:LytTR family transcriptional regulator n=1 Tax=Rhodocytophaga rosea TaxID=2704465 RepID=A0A6C0GPD5_9BACT|nr:LytTR family DNA-binding domain-containing protein [Rhodocytophaga rosea]QHT69918.1 LytTR family transcriptional regulator [Rhodocytophaga rosea]
MLKVSQKEVLYIEGGKDYVKIVTPAKVYLMHETMKDMQENLGDKFIRVHRSYIVAADHIKIIKADAVVLSNDNQIPIGSLYKQELLDYFKK